MFYCRLSKSKQKECLYRLSKPWAEGSAYRFIPQIRDSPSLCCFLLRGYGGMIRLGGFGLFALMKGQAGRTEALSAQVAALGMRQAERCTAVIAERSGIAPTGRAVLVVHTAHFDYAAEVVVHPANDYTRTSSTRTFPGVGAQVRALSSPSGVFE